MALSLWKQWEAVLAAYLSALTDAVNFGIQQLGAVSSILVGKDVFLSIQTGYGKSLVFQILPFVPDICFSCLQE